MSEVAIYLSLGSNIDREHNMRLAIEALRDAFGELKISPIYECAAEGFDGDPFWNLAVEATTALQPGEIDRTLKQIEADLGRERVGKPKFSDRTMDIDLILYGDVTGVVDGIALPRDEIDRYPFVLKPIADIAPDLPHPVNGDSMSQCWKSMKPSRHSLVRIKTELD